jgi:DNA-binding NarL/FixJ family response regulator
MPVTMVVRGLLNKQVSGELGISEITVKQHRGRMMRKMRMRSLPGARDDCGSRRPCDRRQRLISTRLIAPGPGP